MARGLQTADFDYALPSELIAQKPLPRRDDSRLLVLDRGSGTIHHSTFSSLADWLVPGDLFVANNSRVIPARLRGVRVGTGGAVEILLLRRSKDGNWSALARPAKRLKRGDRVEFAARSAIAEPLTAIVEDNLGGGELLLRFDEQADEPLDAYGELPIPPYIRTVPEDATGTKQSMPWCRGLRPRRRPACTLRPDLIGDLQQRGFGWAEVTLHVGLDTFRPVTAESVADHPIHQEWCEVPVATAEAIAACRQPRKSHHRSRDNGGKDPRNTWGKLAKRRPGRFRRIYRNVHCAGAPMETRRRFADELSFAALDATDARERARRKGGNPGCLCRSDPARYRFYSFGDAMLIR